MKQITNAQTPAKSILHARRDKQGVLHVPMHVSSLCRFFTACALSLSSFVFLIAGNMNILTHKPVLFPLTNVLFDAESCLMMSFGLRSLWLWRQLHPLTSTDDLCERFGMEGEQLKRIAVENGIRPDANVGGQDYFRAADFGDITSLLRASAQPLATPDTLLRPAANVEQETGEQLLRAKA